MAGTKQPAEAMGFVMRHFYAAYADGLQICICKCFKSKILHFKMQTNTAFNESVGERSASGETLTEVMVDGAEVRMKKTNVLALNETKCKDHAFSKKEIYVNLQPS